MLNVLLSCFKAGAAIRESATLAATPMHYFLRRKIFMGKQVAPASPVVDIWNCIAQYPLMPWPLNRAAVQRLAVIIARNHKAKHHRGRRRN